MNRENFFRRAISVLFFVSIMIFAATTHAEIKTYAGVGEYFVKEELIDSAKEQAELIAGRDILEQVCFYVKSKSSSQNSSLTNDEIIIISAGILHVTDTKFSITTDNNEIIVKALVTAQIDTDELKKLLEQEIKRRTATN